jgi:hypothetical protein
VNAELELTALGGDKIFAVASTIMPLASVSILGYAATATVTHRNGKRETFLVTSRPSARHARLRLNTQKPISTVGDA